MGVESYQNRQGQNREEEPTHQQGKEEERQYTLSISEEDRQKSFEVEDNRWAKDKQVRDWVILIIAILFWIGFQLSFYFLVPGIR